MDKGIDTRPSEEDQLELEQVERKSPDRLARE